MQNLQKDRREGQHLRMKSGVEREVYKENKTIKFIIRDIKQKFLFYFDDSTHSKLGPESKLMSRRLAILGAVAC